jgi:hypothetical protein
MIPITKGFLRSVTKHNIEPYILADWIEACALFGEDRRLAGSVFVDVLVEEEIYAEQGFCWGGVDEGLGELRRRTRLNQGFPLSVTGRRVERLVNDWREVPVHCFLLLLTLAKRYDNWTDMMPVNYNVQGDLFEDVTRESLTSQFPDWVIYPTGWNRTQPTALPDLVADIAGRLGELQGNVKVWTNPEAKEAGLDLLCYRPFPDGRVGVPLLLLQCASGDWKEPGKVKTPDIDIWAKIITFASRPKRAFATHFAFSQHEFHRVCGLVDGVLFDRYRLLGHRAEQEWASEELRERLRGWVEPRLTTLLELAR